MVAYELLAEGKPTAFDDAKSLGFARRGHTEAERLARDALPRLAGQVAGSPRLALARRLAEG